MPATSAPPPVRRSPLRLVVAACVVIGLLLALVLLAATFLTVTAVTSDSVERRTRTFPAVERLRIHAGSNDVTIVGERRGDIRVEMEIHHNMWRDDWRPTVELHRGDLLRLDTECPVWTFLGAGKCAEFTIRVPRSTEIAVVDGGSSDVRLERLAGRLDVATGSGDVEVDAFRGTAVTAMAGSGDVELRTLRAPRRIRVETGSGDAAVVVPDVRYRVDVRTGSGDEDVQVIDDPRADRAIDVRTGSGDVEVFGVGAP